MQEIITCKLLFLQLPLALHVFCLLNLNLQQWPLCAAPSLLA